MTCRCGLVELDHGQSHRGGRDQALHLQRRLHRHRVGGDRERLEQRPQAGVDLPRALEVAGLDRVPHLAHLRRRRRARRPGCRRRAPSSRVREEDVVVAGEDGHALDRAQLVVVGLLDRDHVVDLRQLGELGRRDVDDHPRGDVVGDQRQVGHRRRRSPRNGRVPRPGWACCSTGSRPAPLRLRPRPPPWSARSSAWCRWCPVPQTISASSPTSSTTDRSSAMCSSSSRVAASPVVPATTRPCEPFSTRKRASLRAAASSTAPDSSKGVAIAVSSPLISAIAVSVTPPRAASRGPTVKRSAQVRRPAARRAGRPA